MKNQKVISFLTLVAFTFTMVSPTVAAPLSSQSDVLSRLKASTLSDHTIKFVTPTGVAAAGTITVTFPAGFNMGTFNVNNVDLATAATCGGSFTDKTLAASPSGATWGAAQAGQVITFTSGSDTIASTSCISIEIGSNATQGGAGVTQITNHATPSTYPIQFTAGADSGSTTIAIITDDQVVITATVDQALAFSISDNTIGFGSLSSGSTRYATGNESGQGTEPTNAHDLQASTNATSGYVIRVQGTTLASGANTIDAIAGGPTALSAGSEQFGIRTTASGGSGTVASPYNGSSGNYGFSTTPTVQTTFASAAGYSANTTYNVNYAANIAGSTEAGSYSATLTYVASATF